MMQESPKLVPIYPITASFNDLGNTYERKQLPLRLAWAITIHKSQGLTLELAWIDIGKTERVPGLTYVAVSRVRSLDSCVIEPMRFECLQVIKKCKNLQYRIAEEDTCFQLFEHKIKKKDTEQKPTHFPNQSYTSLVSHLSVK